VFQGRFMRSFSGAEKNRENREKDGETTEISGFGIEEFSSATEVEEVAKGFAGSNGIH